VKKLLIVLAVLIAGIFVWRATNRPAETTPPVAVIPGATPKAIPQAEAIAGSSLNKAFPEAAAGYKVTFTQEKDGFAQADVSQDGKKVATLTISDTAANPSARDKFKASPRQIAGFPGAPVGSQGSAILVGGRYQVQVRSVGPTFTIADRDAWLARFKLAELDALAKK
jgi:hypothetical protein